MHFKKNRKGYICGSFNKHGIKACSSHIIREQNLKDIILSDIDFILTTISNKSFLDNISSNLNKESKSSKNKLDSIETKISKLTTRKNNALNKFIDDCISKDDYDNLVESINSELNELKSEKLLLESTMSTNLNSNLSSGMCYFKSIASNINDLTPDVVNRLIDKIESVIEVYTRYLTASLCDFQGKTINLRKYITSFLFCAMLFLALTPQFFGFFLPILFFIPIYIGLKGVKQRTMTGFYMTMSVIPVAFMTAVTWIRYGINVKQDYVASLKMIVDSGISQNLAEILIVTGPVLGCVLFIFASIQLYQGIKTKDLFI